jgi:hypothetical protein
MPIEEPDSWRKIRETAAILYCEDVRSAFVRESTVLPRADEGIA